MYIILLYLALSINLHAQLYDNIIWEGRFQPFHKGHLAYLKLLSKKAKNIWIIVLNNESSDIIGGSTNSPVPEFTAEVDNHHKSDKNPYPLWIRYKMVQACVNDEFGLNNNFNIIIGHRLDLDWAFYNTFFPENRVFFTPTRDNYEDSKAKAWKKLGQKVVRIDVSSLPEVSATEVRTKMLSKEGFQELLPSMAIKILQKYKYIY